ncbi:EAL domain-containing protein [Ferriphaselus sp. R-1]|uniref:EAL domain-containing protein n=1 Tax=Ferriphaselus sp. R-1 TaxID=1485544 RepID=UPI000690B276|nr:EAL domain-containing protein [Ferriphaselus sp. R-1]
MSPFRSLRYTVPAMVLLAFMGMTLLSAWFDYHNLEQHVEQDVAIRTVDAAARLGQLAERDLAEFPAHIEQEVMSLAAHVNDQLHIVAVLDPEGRVVFAQQADWSDRPAQDVIKAWSANRWIQAMHQALPLAEWDDRQRRFSVLMSFQYPRAPNELVSSKRGAIYLDYDISDELVRYRAQLFDTVLRDLAIAALLTALLSYVLHRAITQPLRRLQQATRRVATGDASVALTGFDSGELAELAADMRTMAQNVQLAQKGLDQQRLFLKRLLATLPDLVWLKDPEGRYLFCNPRFQAFFGHSEAEIIGRTDDYFVSRELADFFRRNDLLAIEVGKPRVNEEELVFASDGHVENVETIKTPLYGDDGALIGVLGIARDMSERLRDGQALRSSEATLQAILSATEDGLLAISSAGRVLLANARFTELWRIPQTVLESSDDRMLLEHVLDQLVDAPGFLAEVERLYGSAESSFDTLQFKDGRVFERYSCPLLQDGVQTGRVWSFRDVTTRKQAERLLLQERNLFIGGPAVAYAVLLQDGFPLSYISPNVLDVFGYAREEVMQPDFRLMDHVHPEDSARMTAELEAALVAGVRQFEQHYRMRHKDGGWRWITDYTVPVYAGDGSVGEVRGYLLDRTEQHQLMESMRIESAYRQALLDNFPFLVWMKDTASHFLAANRVFAEAAGVASVSALLGKTDLDVFKPELARAYMADDREVVDTGQPKNVEEPIEIAGQPARWFETYKSPVRDGEVIVGTVGFARDITERKQAEEALRNSELRFHALFDGALEGIVVADAETQQIRMTNRTAQTMLGYSAAELLSMTVSDLHPAADLPQVLEVFGRRARGESIPDAEFPVKRKDGSVFFSRIEAAQMELDGRHCAVGFFRDTTERRQAEEVMHRLTYTDPLTGLPNRDRLIEVLDQALSQAHQSGKLGALIKINVDRFKTINDAAGHALGDKLLVELAERIGDLLQPGDVLVRLTGDAFGVLLSSLGHSRTEALQHAQLVVNMLYVALSEPFWLNNENVRVTVSMGVAVYPEGERQGAADVLHNAMLALHRAKQAGGDQSVVFENRMDEVAKQRFQLEHELRSALPARELRLYLQPQVNAAGKTVGAEALVRWQHPQRGLVPPVAFIPIAEETDLIIDLEEWVMAEVCRWLTHPVLASRSLRIAVNVSPRHFRRANFVAWLKELLASSGVEPSRLMLEVTEGLVIENVNDVIAKMHELTALGIHFSVDDFGTGYSSLAYLRRLPLHELKIDKTFVQEAPDNPEGAALVETILSVAKHLHLKVVAEGVETVEQAEFLNTRAVVVHQGYLFGRPDVPERFLERLVAEDKEAQ